ncbi:MAG TPA: hypothetical protein VFN07_02795 [Trueperaceae bacterium]|nr:hypothetical protein [Trueperaceae bacterium]HRP46525.1 hypothetical protein [Trueperaceae bacterium]
MRNLKNIFTALIVTLAVSGLAVGSVAAYSPANAVFAGTSNLPGEWDVG